MPEDDIRLLVDDPRNLRMRELSSGQVENADRTRSLPLLYETDGPADERRFSLVDWSDQRGP
jgi:hypothetical protein